MFCSGGRTTCGVSSNRGVFLAGWVTDDTPSGGRRWAHEVADVDRNWASQFGLRFGFGLPQRLRSTFCSCPAVRSWHSAGPWRHGHGVTSAAADTVSCRTLLLLWLRPPRMPGRCPECGAAGKRIEERERGWQFDRFRALSAAGLPPAVEPYPIRVGMLNCGQWPGTPGRRRLPRGAAAVKIST